jgi:carbamoyltransferase
MNRVAGLAGFGRSSACLYVDGKLSSAVPEEACTHRKNDPGIPAEAFAWCCESSGVDPSALDYVAFAEKPVQRFIRVLGELATGFPGTARSFPSTLRTWLGDRLWLKSRLVEALHIPAEKLLFVERGVAQASSAFLTSEFDEAAVLVVDNTGEWATTTLAVGRSAGNATSIDVIAEIQHPHSLAHVLEAVSHHLMLPEHGGQRWLAALDAFGTSRFAPELSRMVPSGADGTYSLDPRMFELRSGRTRFAQAAQTWIGPPRRPGQPLLDESRWADIAASVASVVAARCVELTRIARERTGKRALCLGGSVFLHPRVLTTVLRESPFDAIHVDPYLDEAGAANGAALHVLHVAGDVPRTRSPSLNDGHSLPFEMAAVDELELRAEVLTDEEIVMTAVDLLAEGTVIGWGEGPPEVTTSPTGRRALLADPGSKKALRRLRRDIKESESHVPLALLALDTAIESWASGGVPHPAVSAAQALVDVPEDIAVTMPDALHADGRALVRAVDPDEQPRLAAVLRAFAERTGRPPILALSSMNRSGEPPALTARDALRLVRQTPIETLFWGSHAVHHVDRHDPDRVPDSLTRTTELAP